MPTKENWPFLLQTDNLPVQEHLYYAFTDSDTALDIPGAGSALELAMFLAKEDGIKFDRVSTDPNDLCEIEYCILSGREYIDRIKSWTTATSVPITVFGKWSTPAAKTL